MINFCWHNWTKWSEVYSDYSANRIQFRNCKKCNKVIKRKAFWMVAVKNEDINSTQDEGNK